MGKLLTGMIFMLLASSTSAAEVARRTANDGQLVMKDIPVVTLWVCFWRRTARN